MNYRQLIFMLLALSFVGCASKKSDTGPEISPQDIENSTSSTTDQTYVDGSINDESINSSGMELGGDSDSSLAGSLQTIYFDFNSSELNSQFLDILKTNAQVLKENLSMQVQIEGHCDERGGIQYNLALGEKRARVIKKYLELYGVEPNRLSIISYGKERPKVFGHSEEIWSQNRRGNFRITKL